MHLSLLYLFSGYAILCMPYNVTTTETKQPIIFNFIYQYHFLHIQFGCNQKMIRIINHFHCKYENTKLFVLVFPNECFQWYFGCTNEVQCFQVCLALWAKCSHILQAYNSCQGFKHQQSLSLWLIPTDTKDYPGIGQATDWLADS